MNTVIKVLLALFLVVCVGVHVYGLLEPFSSESTLSHIIHLIGYGTCLLAVLLKKNPFSLSLYLCGALYPFFYHALCAWDTYELSHSLNYICILVIVVLPLGAVWVAKKQNE